MEKKVVKKTTKKVKSELDLQVEEIERKAKLEIEAQKAKVKKELEDKKAKELKEKEIIAESKKERDQEEKLQERFNKLYKPNITGVQLNISNLNLYFEQHIKYNKDFEEADKKLKEVEAKSKEIYLSEANEKVRIARKQAYLVIEDLAKEAIAEFLTEKKDDKLKEYTKKRAEIKAKFAKVK